MRDRFLQVRDAVLNWLRFRFNFAVGPLGLTIQIRQFDHSTLRIHWLALMLNFEEYQLGFMLEPGNSQRPSFAKSIHGPTLHIHGIFWYKEINF